MVRRRHVLSAIVVCGATAASLPACFADLPPALTCPPPEQRVMGDCSAALGTTAKAGCLDGALHECLQGPGVSCACAAGDCPIEPTSCFSDECPPAVRAVAPNARCVRPTREAFTTFAAEGCICGCAACAAVCDGRGPSLGVKFPSNAGDPPAPLVVTLSLPAAGTLGVYVRARGIASLAFAVGRDKTQLFAQPFPLANEAKFQERVFEATTKWTEPSQAPKQLAFIAQPGPTLAEIDCVIPFVLP